MAKPIEADVPEGVVLAPDERVVSRGTFSFSTLLFFLHWKMAVTSKRIVGKAPNTVLGIIPLGSTSVSYPLHNVAGVVTKTRISLFWIIIGLIFLFGGLQRSPNVIGIILGLIALAGSVNAQIFITNSGGGVIGHNIAIFERSAADAFVREVNAAIATYAHQSPIAAAAAPVASSVSDKLAELTRLRDAGHMTANEFEAKRLEVISRI